MPNRLTDAERAALPGSLPGWSLVDGKEAIVRNFKFRDFNEAWGFMNRVALLAESQGHHRPLDGAITPFDFLRIDRYP